MPSGLALVFAAIACAQEVVVADFEGDAWNSSPGAGASGGWVATGSAFGSGPARGTLPGQMRVAGFVGRGLVDSFVGGDVATGTLTSPPFEIVRPFLRFRIGGGNHPGETELTLEVDGNVVRRATGRDSERLLPESFDVREFIGKSARIVIVDRATGGWGHVNVDQIVLVDAPVDPVRDSADEEARELAEADASVAAAAAALADDPRRPTCHLLPAANWLNDPNGLLFQPDSPNVPVDATNSNEGGANEGGASNGWYHAFFQHNPYGDGWGEMHWGHARSRDLVHWQRLPIALGPSFLRGEEHCFSGSALNKDDGTPVLIYTSIGRSIGARLPEQWIAVPTDHEWLHWRKPAEDPVITEALHVDEKGRAVKVREWRDPYLFRAGGRVHCVCGGNFDESSDGNARASAPVARAAVQVYRAEDAALTKWRWLGPLFVHPDAGVGDIECPIFFPIGGTGGTGGTGGAGGKWALITSQGRPVDWFVGTLDEATMRFHTERRGKVDAGCVYAPSVLHEGVPQPILFGWIDGFPETRGWRHCLTLPRRLALDAAGNLTQEPARELAALRDPARHEQHGDVVLDQGAPFHFTIDGEVGGAAFDFELEGDGVAGIRLAIGATEIAVSDLVGSSNPGAGGAAGTTALHGFVDHSVVELYAGGRCLTRVVAPAADGAGVELRAAARVVLHRIEAWALTPAVAR